MCPRRAGVYIHTFPMRDRGPARCVRISAHPVHTLTGPIYTKTFSRLASGNNNFECSSLSEIDTDTKTARGTYGPRTFKRRQRRRTVEIKNERERGKERERERVGERRRQRGLRYTLQVRARVSRAANEPAAARFWLHGPRY